MSIKLMSAIFETEFRDLPYTKDGEERKSKASTAKLVLLAIADHANDYGESAYPGYDKLEIKTALSRQGIADTLEALKQNGLLLVSDEPSRLGTNNYSINIECFPKMAESSHLTGTSQATLLGVVKPLDLNHQLTISKPSLPVSKTDNTKAEYNLLFKGDFREYPEHLWEVAQALQNEWGFALPAKPQKKQSKGEYSYYIMAMEDIKTASGEFNASNILIDVRHEFVDYMEKHGGIAPFTVGKPSALITSVSAKAREMRMKKPEKPRVPTPQPDYSEAIPNPGRKPLIPRGIG